MGRHRKKRNLKVKDLKYWVVREIDTSEIKIISRVVAKHVHLRGVRYCTCYDAIADYRCVFNNMKDAEYYAYLEQLKKDQMEG